VNAPTSRPARIAALAAVALLLAGGAALVAFLMRNPGAADRSGSAGSQPTDGPAEVGNPNLLVLRTVDASSGGPLAGAVVRWYAGPRSGRVVTDGRGVCSFDRPPVETKNVWVTIECAGHVPRSLWAPGEDARHHIPSGYAIKLEPGKGIGGTVRDESGRGIAGATVSFTTLILPDEGPPGPFTDREHLNDTSVLTDADGHWYFDGAPSDLRTVGIAVSHPRFTIHPPAGRDAKAAGPSPLPPEKLRDFSAVTVLRRDPATADRLVDRSATKVAGPQVVANAARDVIARFRTSEGPIEALDDARRVAGVAVAPDGKPLSGVNVALATAAAPLHIINGEPTGDVRRLGNAPGGGGRFSVGGPAQRRANLFVTAGDGRFDVTAAAAGESFALFAYHPTAGFALVDRDAVTATGFKVTLRPWGRVQGIVRAGDKVAPKIDVTLQVQLPAGASTPLGTWAAQVTTDHAGRFVFDQVPPGEARLSRVAGPDDRRPVPAGTTVCTVKEGETAEADLVGGAGQAAPELPASEPKRRVRGKGRRGPR
jgi:hypothetical protein